MWARSQRESVCYLARMSERIGKGQVISFEDRDELAGKARLKSDIERVRDGLLMALEGRGKIMPDVAATDNTELSEIRTYFEQYIGTALAGPLTKEVLDEATVKITLAKIILSRYLSEEQFVEVFETGSLS